MKVQLLFPDRDQAWEIAPDLNWEDRFQDLRLGPVMEAMGRKDPWVQQICRQMLSQPLGNRAEILYRQEILKDCLHKPQLIRSLYSLCQEAEERRRNTWYRMNSAHLTTIYSSAEDLLKIYMETLVAIRKALEPEDFSSPGLKQLQNLLRQELSENYLDQVRQLRLGISHRDGILISAGFGPYLQGIHYRKRQPAGGFSRLHWLVLPSYTLADRDMNGARDLEVRQDRALNEAANAMAQAAASLQGFVDQLRGELAFYVGAINLQEDLNALGVPTCFPEFSRDRDYGGLYDGSLALTGRKAPVGNTVRGENAHLFLITGANQGGKTTFLRSVGLCQIMAQCGLFVCGDRVRIPIATQIFTHFCREEDRKMDSGRLAEELERMSALADRLRSGALVLSNESFSSTNDRDGSEIFMGITRALLENQVDIFAVTHLMSYAQAMADREDVLCLRAEREADGSRSFRLVPGKPQAKAFAEDLYRQIFSEDLPQT